METGVDGGGPVGSCDEIMRTFIAIDIPEPLKEKLRALQAEMKRFNAPVRWVTADGLHLTLKFLGEVSEAKLPSLCDPLTDIARSSTPFAIYLERLGTFPREQTPRVIWVGARSDGDGLARLARSVENAMTAQGFPAEERGFNPHLTLGRVKGADNLFRLMTYVKLYSESQEVGSFPADTMYLYKSTLTPAGSVYEKVTTFAFGR